MSDRWPDSFGDVTGEYLALRNAAGLVGPAHDVVWVEGPDAVEFLDGQLSQDVAAIDGGGVARSLLLEPRGKLVALLWVLRMEGRVGLLCDVGHGPSVADALDRFLFRVDCSVRADEAPALGVWGPEAPATITAPAHGLRERSGVTVARVDVGDLARVAVIGSSVDALTAAGAVPVGSLATTTVRIEAGEPVMGVDVDEGTIPHETGLVPDSVSFTKGCYLGQELVARIDSRGHVNRHLRGITVTDTVLPPEGAALVVGDKEVGRLGSVGESLTLRAPVALAFVRREVAVGDQVEIRWTGGAAAATVRDLPMDGDS